MTASEREARPALLVALFVAVFAASAGTNALTPLFPELKEEFGVGDGPVRLLTSCFTIAYALSGFLMGAVCDRIGRRRVLLASLALYAGASGLLLACRDFHAFLALRTLAGLGTGGVAAASLALVADLVPYARRGRAMSLVLSGNYVAVVIGIPAASLLAQVRLTAIFAVLAALTAGALLWVYLGLREPDREERPAAVWSLLGAALRQRGALAILVTTGLNTLAAFAVLSSLADHCDDRFDADLQQRSLLFLVLGLAGLPGAFAAAVISDRLGKRRLVLLALGASVVAVPLLLLPASLAVFLLPAGLVAAVQALRPGPAAAILTGLSAPGLRGSLTGWNSAFSGVGLALGTWLGGVLYGAQGLWGPVSLATAAVVVSSLVFATGVPEPQAEDAEGASAALAETAAERQAT